MTYTPVRYDPMDGTVESAPVCGMDLESARAYALKAFGELAAVARDSGHLPNEIDIVFDA